MYRGTGAVGRVSRVLSQGMVREGVIGKVNPEHDLEGYKEWPGSYVSQC